MSGKSKQSLKAGSGKSSPLMGKRDAKKLAAIFDRIEECEKAAAKLLLKTARDYYDAGNILSAAIRNWNRKYGKLSVKSVSEVSGFPELRIAVALKVFKGFENNPEALKGISLRDALKLTTPPSPSGEAGYNRIDLGGDPGQLNFDFGELFELPATGNLSLKNYRTVGDLLGEIIVVRRAKDSLLTSKRFVRFFEDVPQNPSLRSAFKAMSMKTQAAVEDYLAALEQEEEQHEN